MPLGARLVFALAVAGLAVLVAYVATGQVGRAAASVGSVVGGFFGAVTTTHSPSPVPVVVSDAPTLTPPVQPETNEATVEVSGTIPAAIVGKTDFSINLYLTVKADLLNSVLETGLRDERTLVILAAIQALGKIGDARALIPQTQGEPALVRALHYGAALVDSGTGSGDEAIRTAGAYALCAAA